MFLSSNWLRVAALSGALCTLVGVPACSSDQASDAGPSSAGNSSAGTAGSGGAANSGGASNGEGGASDTLDADIIREGSTTNAALKAFLDTPADDWPWAGGQFVAPKDQASLAADTAETFTWMADSTDAPAPSDVLAPDQQQGQVFMLVFSTPEGAQVLRVFTSLTEYTPDAAAWAKLVAIGAPITLSITSATYENDQLTGDGGPHHGQTLTFTIQ
jgi:hypothetical protein